MTVFPISLIISFYNNIEYLKLILAALERQSFKDFEVIVADDGSRPDVVKELKEIVATSTLAIQHIWQEDIGFRKTKILNEAVRKSRSEYLAFIDGDCIPHYKFVEEHYRNREPKVLLAGRRVYLSERISKSLGLEKIKNGYLEKQFTFKQFIDVVFGKSRHVIKGVYVKNKFLRKKLNRSVKGVLGCNFSVHKKDLVDINGFDERYQAPGIGEDTDIEVRFLWSDVKVKMIKNIAIQYHIHHPRIERTSENLALFEKIKQEKKIYTPYGIIQDKIES